MLPKKPMYKAEIPIVVVAYRKAQPLNRLFLSLKRSHFSWPVKLIVSIDGGASDEVINLANNFIWENGDKEIIQYEENLGLRKHIIRCGDLSQLYDGIVLLEDDLFVSPWFYEFAQNSIDFILEEKKTCGLALYSPRYNESTNLPFEPVQDGSSCYYMQLPCSWGQVWVKNHWKEFKAWYENKSKININSDESLPHNIRVWPDTSWKKHFASYMVDNDKYFVYPYKSYSTNFGDAGQHHTGTHLFQVPLVLSQEPVDIRSFKESSVKYDAFCEMHPESLKRWCPWLKDFDIVVDMHGTKEKVHCIAKHIITSKKSTDVLRSFAKALIPIECNVINDINGNDLSFTETANVVHVENVNKYLWQKSTTFKELFYHYPLDRRHVAVHEKKLEVFKSEQTKLRKRIKLLEDEKKILVENLAFTKYESQMLRNSYSFRVGQCIVKPISYFLSFMPRRN